MGVEKYSTLLVVAFILVLEVDSLCVLSMVKDQFVGCAYGHHNVIIGS